MPDGFATDRGTSHLWTQMILQLGQRPGSKPQAYVRRAGGGGFDNQLFDGSTMDPGSTGSLVVVQPDQTIGKEAFDPLVSIGVVKAG